MAEKDKKEKKVRAGRCRLENVRASYLKIETPTASVENGTKKFRANFIMDPKTADGRKAIKAAEAAIERVKNEMWGAKASKISFKDDRYALLNGDDQTNGEGEVYEGYEGMKAVKANNPKRPKLFDRDKSPLDVSDGKIYSGCFVNAVVRFYAIKDPKKGGAGIFCTVEGIQFVKDGEAFGGAGIDDDAFDDLGDDESDEDSDDDDLV